MNMLHSLQWAFIIHVIIKTLNCKGPYVKNNTSYAHGLFQLRVSEQFTGKEVSQTHERCVYMTPFRKTLKLEVICFCNIRN